MAVPDYGAPITVRDLLQHTSGLHGYPALEALSGRRVESNKDLLDLLASQRSLNRAARVDPMASLRAD